MFSITYKDPRTGETGTSAHAHWDAAYEAALWLVCMGYAVTLTGGRL